MVTGVEHVVSDVSASEEAAEGLGHLHTHGADQHGFLALMPIDDLVQDGLILFIFGEVDHVLVVDTGHLDIGGDGHHGQLVDLHEFGFFGDGGTGHTGQAFKHAKVVLQGDGGKGLGAGFDGDVFLGFQGLMQSIRKAAAWHLASGKFIHDHHLVVDHHIFLIVFKEGEGAQELADVVELFALVHKTVGGHSLAALAFRLVCDAFVVVDLGMQIVQGAHHKEVFFMPGQHIAALFTEVHAVLALFHGVKEVVVQLMQFLVPQVITFGVVDQFLELAFLHELQKSFVARRGPLDQQEVFGQEVVVRVGIILPQIISDLTQIALHQSVLGLHHLMHHGAHFRIEVFVLSDGAADDERSSGLVDEDAVHLVHDGVIEAALHQLLR